MKPTFNTSIEFKEVPQFPDGIDGFDIKPVCQVGEREGQTFYETCEEEEADFYTVYAFASGGALAIADCSTKEVAIQLEQLLVKVAIGSMKALVNQTIKQS